MWDTEERASNPSNNFQLKKQSIVPYDLPLLEQFVPGQSTMIRPRYHIGFLDNQ